MANLIHPEIFETVDGQLRPKVFYRTRHSRGRSATRGVVTSSLALADALEGEEPTPGGESAKYGRQHKEISSVIVSSMMTVSSPTDIN